LFRGNLFEELEVSVEPVGRRDQLESQWNGRPRRTVLERKDDLLSLTREVRITVAEGVQIGASSKGLPRLSATLLARVMHQDQGEIERALKLAEVGEQTRDVLAVVLIEGMKAHQRIEQEKPRAVARERGTQALLIRRAIETKNGFGDDDKVELVDVDAPVPAEALQSRAPLSAFVLGKVNEAAPGRLDGESSQGRGAGSDAQGKIEPEEALETFRGSAQNTGSAPAPQPLDEPAILRLLAVEIPRVDGVELVRTRGLHGQSTLRARATWR